MAFTAHDIS